MNARLRSLVIGNSIFTFGGNLLVPLYALFTDSLGATIQVTGLLFAAKFLANAVADVVVMRYHDKMIATEDTYRISMLVRGVGWIFVGLFPSLPSLLAVQILTGLAEGFGTPAFSTLMTKHMDKGKHMKQWATWDLIKNPLVAISTSAGAWIAADYGFSIIFYIMGATAFAASMVPITRRSRKKKVVKEAYRLLFERG